MLNRLPTCLALLAIAACSRESAGPQNESQTVTAAPPAVRYVDHLAAGGNVPPGATLQNPKGADSATVKAGETLFGAMNCDGCHGIGGSGWVGPSLADKRWRYGGSDAEIFNSIYYGRPKGMPAFGGTVGTDGVWTLVTYVRSLSPSSDMATESWEGQ